MFCFTEARLFSLQSMARQQAQELLQRHPSMAGRLPTTRLGFWWYWFTHWVGSLWFELRWHVRQVRSPYLLLKTAAANAPAKCPSSQVERLKEWVQCLTAFAERCRRWWSTRRLGSCFCWPSSPIQSCWPSPLPVRQVHGGQRFACSSKTCFCQFLMPIGPTWALHQHPPLVGRLDSAMTQT